jgi:hypothetical protein
MSSTSSLLLLAAVSLLGFGCAAPSAPVTSDEAYEGAGEPHFYVEATYRRVLTDVPTYGYYPTEPRVSIAVETEDAAMAREHPGFDGYERAFVLLPRQTGRGVLWERLDLRYTGPGRHGYFGERRFDTYAVDAVRLTDEDLSLVLEHGVAVGFDTNVGTVWAQEPGENYPVREKR